MAVEVLTAGTLPFLISVLILQEILMAWEGNSVVDATGVYLNKIDIFLVGVVFVFRDIQWIEKRKVTGNQAPSVTKITEYDILDWRAVGRGISKRNQRIKSNKLKYFGTATVIQLFYN